MGGARVTGHICVSRHQEVSHCCTHTHTGGGPAAIQLLHTTGRPTPNTHADLPFFHCVTRVTLFALHETNNSGISDL